MLPLNVLPKLYQLRVEMSNKNAYARVLKVNMEHGKEELWTWDAKIAIKASTREPGFLEKHELASGGDKTAAAAVGKVLAERGKEKGMKGVQWLRPSGQRYHGRVKSLVDSMVKNGLPLY